MVPPEPPPEHLVIQAQRARQRILDYREPAENGEVKIERTTERPPAPYLCSCILGARRFGVNLPPGNAEDLIPNSTPVVGGVALFNYSGVHHTAVITELSEQTFSVIETNYKKCQKTQRDIRYNDPSIRGFAKF